MSHDNRWEFFTDHHAYDIFTEEERKALEEAKIKLEGAKREMRRKDYTEKVISMLSSDASEWEAVKRKQGRQHIKDILSAGVENIAKDHQYKWADILKGVES